MFFYWKSAITERDCNNLIKEFDHKDQLKAETGIYQGLESQPEIRETKLNWLQPDHPMNKVILDYVLKANDEVWHYDLAKLTPCQFAKYEVGGYYGWHQDTGYTWDKRRSDPRKLSVTVQLSNPDDYKGGEFQFWYGNKDPQIPSIQSQGSILVFESHLWHQITPVTEGVRYSLVTWILGPPFV